MIALQLDLGSFRHALAEYPRRGALQAWQGFGSCLVFSLFFLASQLSLLTLFLPVSVGLPPSQLAFPNPTRSMALESTPF